MSAPNSLTRFWIPAAIVLFWGIMMTSLLKDRILPERIRARQALVDDEVLATKWHDIAEWSWISRQGRRCGASGLEIVQEKRPNLEWRNQITYRMDQVTTLDVAAFGQQQTVVIKIAVQLRRDFQVDCFRAQAVTPLLTLECEGFAEGNRLYYRLSNIARGLEQTAQTYDYGYLEVGKQSLSMIDAVKPMMARHGNLIVGETYSFDTFDPFGGMSMQKAVVRVAGTEEIQVGKTKHDCFRLETTVGDITRKTWVDEMGQTIRREILMGYMGETATRARVGQAYPAMTEKITLPEIDRAEFKTQAKEIHLTPAAPLASLLGASMDLSGKGATGTSATTPEKQTTSEPTLPPERTGHE